MKESGRGLAIIVIVKTGDEKGGGMSELLWKIYERIVSEESDAYEGRKRSEERIEELIQKYAADFKQEETEAVRTLAYAAALKAEQEGFRLGVRFAVRLFMDW